MVGSDPGETLLSELSAALLQWRQSGRLSDIVNPVLSWSLGRFGAERGLFFSERAGGEYRVWGSRHIDGEVIPNSKRSISHFAVMRAAGQDVPVLFRDTRHDRRFRTETEVERGVRSRSILLIPIPGVDSNALLYLDSRFRVIDEPEEGDPEWRVAAEILAIALRFQEEKRARRELERRLKKSQTLSKPELEEARSTTPLKTAKDPVEFHGFITRSALLIETIDELKKLAKSEVPILIEGESGTGKELLARAVHVESGRAGPFDTLHCGTIPESLVEAELFGHVAGAFTSAERDREGLLAQASGGTLFLDAVEEASPTLQGALLRVLETGRYRPLGSDEEVNLEARIIGATFAGVGTPDGGSPVRIDLYYRLAGARFHIPPLRDRREDIIPIIQRLLEVDQSGKTSVKLATGAEELIVAHDWPGNVREMYMLTRRLLAVGEAEITEQRFREITGVERAMPRREGDMLDLVDRAEREVILRALNESGGNKSNACKLLGMSRRTLYRRMQKHGIPLQ